jgi:hypothetical protein
LEIKEASVTAVDLLTKEKQGMMLHKDGSIRMKIDGRNGHVWKVKLK